ncbi:MAG: hypothetical protein Q4Q58_06155 [Thermoplasmata archaeon]|nr:hypothetical protein [Thermoplasmata archaeon]
MSGGKEMTILAVIMVVLFMGGALAMYALSSVMEGDDLIKTTREYTVSGTVDGVEYTGSATATYMEENSNYPAYTFSLTASDASGNGVSYTFWIFFESDGTPVSTIYGYAGESTVGEEAVTVWTWADGTCTYTFTVATDLCRVPTVTVSDGGVSLTAELTTVLA